MKPSAVKTMHPIMREREKQKPHQEYGIVDYRTPQKSITHHFNVHHSPPVVAMQQSRCLIQTEKFWPHLSIVSIKTNRFD
jgi:hypothetical protein